MSTPAEKISALADRADEIRLMALAALDQISAIELEHADELAVDELNHLYAVQFALASQALTPEPSP